MMTKWEDISNGLREATLAAHQPGRGYQVISKLSKVHQSTDRKHVPQKKTSQTAANLPRSGHPSRSSPGQSVKLTEMTVERGSTGCYRRFCEMLNHEVSLHHHG
ncbi:hypothetical protein ILYODFUR_032390 [Ilyodon furcidens]|uniref:Uncharacterized protein n=1 Tax=Ilyodon furcidens TaxID=33524 RepID=A0ABV0UPW6_9TELE